MVIENVYYRVSPGHILYFFTTVKILNEKDIFWPINIAIVLVVRTSKGDERNRQFMLLDIFIYSLNYEIPLTVLRTCMYCLILEFNWNFIYKSYWRMGH